MDPMDDLRQKNLSGLRFETLLRPLARAGKVVLAPEDRSAMAARARACVGLETLDETQLRMLNPHTYPVGLELASTSAAGRWWRAATHFYREDALWRNAT